MLALPANDAKQAEYGAALLDFVAFVCAFIPITRPMLCVHV